MRSVFHQPVHKSHDNALLDKAGNLVLAVSEQEDQIGERQIAVVEHKAADSLVILAVKFVNLRAEGGKLLQLLVQIVPLQYDVFIFHKRQDAVSLFDERLKLFHGFVDLVDRLFQPFPVFRNLVRIHFQGQQAPQRRCRPAGAGKHFLACAFFHVFPGTDPLIAQAEMDIPAEEAEGVFRIFCFFRIQRDTHSLLCCGMDVVLRGISRFFRVLRHEPVQFPFGKP